MKGRAVLGYRLPFTDARVSDRLGGFLCYRADSRKGLAEWDGESPTVHRLVLRARRAPTLPVPRSEPGGITLNGQQIYDEAEIELAKMRAEFLSWNTLQSDFLMG